jgi:hypothetical protein
MGQEWNAKGVNADFGMANSLAMGRGNFLFDRFSLPMNRMTFLFE